MKKNLCSTLLGLSIFVSGIVVCSSADAFELRNLWTGDCLGVKAGNANKGAAMIVWKCDSTSNQQFTVVPASTNASGEPTFYIYDQVDANRVLGVANNGSPNVYTPVITWTNDGSANQQWTMTYVITDFQGQSCYAIRSTGILTEYGETSLDYYGEFNTLTLYGQRNWGQPVVIENVDSFKATVGIYSPIQDPSQYWCAY